jgi:hypothetical protein|tara:strand:+ start:69 stop:221 length:153 start_codon:yes stop_codon:yes gene_type:complete
MPRNTMKKDEFKVRVLKLKQALSNEPDGDGKCMANKYLNKVLDAIDEYRD